jgi:uncharacterized protein
MVDAAQAGVVVAILTRAPSAGGKSRLFAALGIEPDPALLTALFLDTVDAVRRAQIRCVVAVAPASACDEVRALVPDGITVTAQPEGTLGDRMRGVMGTLFDGGARAVALVGSDLPEISAAAIREACAIACDDPRALAVGPALDGGYYLIAAARVPDVFDRIEWGSAAVLAQTRDAAQRDDLHVRIVGSIGDVDTPGDLERVLRTPGMEGSRTVQWARRQRIGPMTDH